MKNTKGIIIKNTKQFLKFIRENKSYFVGTILPKLVKTEYSDIFDKSHYNVTESIETEISLEKMISFDAGRLYNIVLALSQLNLLNLLILNKK